MSELSLHDKVIFVTGVSRPRGIGAGIVKRLVRAGASVVFHGNTAYDQASDYPDAAAAFGQSLAAELTTKQHSAHCLPSSDLAAAGEPENIINAARAIHGRLNGLVVNHAYSTQRPIGHWTAADISAHLTVNVQATMLMVQAFAAQLPEGRRGAITLFTSGQYLGPMVDEIAYAVSKDATIGLCRQLAAALAPSNIQVNCINPGPTDTGYVFDASYAAAARLFPAGRWGIPDDAARLVHFLQSDYSSWITGQVIASEGGFNRYITKLEE